MRFIQALRITIAAAAVAALLAAGCKQKADSNEENSAKPNNNNGGGGGVTSNTEHALDSQPAGQSIRATVDAKKAAFDLTQIGLAYQNFSAANGNGPAKIDDLYPYMEGTSSPAAKGLASGKYILYLNVSPAQLANDPSNTVLGYYKDTPTAGGPVLMGDGSVDINMTADEFKKAPKAGK